jgi:hypothetical protein
MSQEQKDLQGLGLGWVSLLGTGTVKATPAGAQHRLRNGSAARWDHMAGASRKRICRGW